MQRNALGIAANALRPHLRRPVHLPALLCWLVAAGLLFGPDALAACYLQEDVNYLPGILGTNSPWTNPTNLITVVSGSLTYPGLTNLSPAGNTVSVTQGVGPAVTYRPFATAATNGSVYFSFVLNYSSVNANVYLAGLLPSGVTAPNGNSVDPCDVVVKGASSGYNLGIRAKNGTTDYASASLTLDSAQLVVGRYNFSSGQASLYLNPTPGGTEPSAPDAASAGTAVSDLNYLFLRAANTTAGAFTIDAFRIASTWEEVTPGASVISDQGNALSRFLESLMVQQYWIKDYSVNWLTGSTNPASGSAVNMMTLGTSTHCSAFAASAAAALGVYLLHPPQHSDVDLANAQQDWLFTNTMGWVYIADVSTNAVMADAQALANQGNLVIATYKSSSGSGHIAILRPSARTDITTYGPQECQSGTYNFNSTNVMTGFNQHASAFPNGIRYFYHAVTNPILPVSPVFTSGSFSNGIYQAKASTITGRRYKLQCTADCASWTDVLAFTNANNSSNFSCVVPAADSPPAGTPCRFYRLLAQ